CSWHGSSYARVSSRTSDGRRKQQARSKKQEERRKKKEERRKKKARSKKNEERYATSRLSHQPVCGRLPGYRQQKISRTDADEGSDGAEAVSAAARRAGHARRLGQSHSDDQLESI